MPRDVENSGAKKNRATVLTSCVAGAVKPRRGRANCLEYICVIEEGGKVLYVLAKGDWRFSCSR